MTTMLFDRASEGSLHCLEEAWEIESPWWEMNSSCLDSLCLRSLGTAEVRFNTCFCTSLEDSRSQGMRLALLIASLDTQYLGCGRH